MTDTHNFILPSGETVTIDAADREVVDAAGPWRALRHSHTTYVQANVRKPAGAWTGVRLHRLLLDPPDGVEVDHINRNGLDNRRGNLRLASRSQNMANSPPNAGGSSKYKGVSWHKRRGKWQAFGRAGRDKQVHLGNFANEVEAARAYDEHAYATWGEFAWLNRDQDLDPVGEWADGLDYDPDEVDKFRRHYRAVTGSDRERPEPLQIVADSEETP